MTIGKGNASESMTLEELFRSNQTAIDYFAEQIALVDSIERELAAEKYRGVSEDGLVVAEANGIGEFTDWWCESDEHFQEDDGEPNHDLIYQLANSTLEAGNDARLVAGRAHIARWRATFPELFPTTAEA